MSHLFHLGLARVDVQHFLEQVSVLRLDLVLPVLLQLARFQLVLQVRIPLRRRVIDLRFHRGDRPQEGLVLSFLLLLRAESVSGIERP